MTPEDAIAQLTQRIYRLEQEVTELRQRQGLPTSRPKVPTAASPPREPSRSAPVPPPAARGPRPTRGPSDSALEANVIGTWFARVGMLAILIGAGFAFKYAVDRGIIGPTARVFIGLAAGLAFVAWGEVVFRRGWDLFAQAVTGGGIALWYLSILSALHLFDLMAPGSAFVALLAITAIGAALAFRQDALALAVLALVGGFLNPFLIGADRLDPLTFLAYVVALDVLVGILAGRRWAALDRVALVGTMAVVLTVTSRESFSQRVSFATVLFAIFASLPFLQEYLAGDRGGSNEAREARKEPPDVLLGATGAYFGYMLWALGESHRGWRGVFALCLAGLFVGFAYAARELRLRLDTAWMIGIALVLATLFVPIQLSGAQIGAAWTAEGFVLLVLTVRILDDERFRAATTVLLGIGTMSTLAALSDAYPPERLVLTWPSLFAAITVACLCAAAYVQTGAEPNAASPAYRLSTVPSYIWGVAANLVVLVWMSQELVSHIERTVPDPGQAMQFALTALWGLYGAVLLFAGVAARARWARFAGVALLSITVGKLALYDLWLLRTSYRIIAFIGLGAILLVCSVLYQRFRDLIVADDDEPPAPIYQPPAPVVGTTATARKGGASKKAPVRKQQQRKPAKNA